MKKIIVILCSVALLFFIGYRAYENFQAKQAAMNQIVPEKIIPVRSGHAIRREIIDKFKASGNIKADADILLYSKASGKISKNLVHLGTVVNPGMVVAIINRDEIGYTYNPFEVKSDVKGIVAQVMQNPGTMITPNTPLISMVDIDIVKVTINVDEVKVRFIEIGKEATVSLEAFPGEVFSARVSNISPICNPQNRTVEVELKMPNPRHRLKPGMYAEAEIIEGKRNALIIPVAAVVERLGKKYIFSIIDGRVKLVPVMVGKVISDNIEIVSGINETDYIVTFGADRLEENDKVSIVKS